MAKQATKPVTRVPVLRSDEEAEAFLAQDLSDLDFSQFKRVRFEFEPKAARVNMRLPESLVKTLKERARKRGIPYQRFTREMIELGLASSEKAKPARRA
jgi:predicted DNA binding CopG/RHH family protein